jgi:HD-GYP domain-containing protein (c-di-GMP phosphodiesterase class II)
VDAADVLLVNRHIPQLEYAAETGFRTTGIRRSSLRMGEGMAGVSALERRIISVPDLRDPASGFKRSSLLSGEGIVAYYAVPLVAKGMVKGILEIMHRSPLVLDDEQREFLEALAARAAIAIDNTTLFDELQRSNIELMLAYDATLEGWARALDLRDRVTERHTERVTEMTINLARVMGMKEQEIVHIRHGALMHDIGKIGIPDSILRKEGPLTEGEREIMRQHPVYAFEMLRPIAYLRPALDIPYCHHERWDGTGYPRGLKGEQIPLAARIFALADVWDAVFSADRPYRRPLSLTEACDHIRSLAGTHLDPKVVDAFLHMQEHVCLLLPDGGKKKEPVR